jgi:hypothetical protein
MSACVSSYFVHIQVYQHDIANDHAEKAHLLLKNLFVLATLHGVETFSIDDVVVRDVGEPDSGCAAGAMMTGLENREFGGEESVEEGAFT